MYLTPEERAMLDGEQGPGVKKAMEIVTALGEIYGAEELVPVASVQVAGVSYKNLGDAGLDFLRDWAQAGAKVRVPTTLNPAGMDLDNWRELGVSEKFARKQMEVIRAFEAMGIKPTCTCTPYLVGNAPRLGEHIAWSESSAVSFANSILGARTNREGGPSALAAAIAGRTAKYGLHLDKNRLAHYIIYVRCPVRNEADFGALGYMVGRWVKNEVPYFRDLKLEVGSRKLGFGSLTPNPQSLTSNLKALGAAMAASGAVALYHVEGITPEARAGDVVAPDAEKIAVESLAEGYEALNSAVKEIDLVWIGCPHASLEEIEQVADLLGDRRVRSKLWVTTARQIRDSAEEEGLVGRIQAAGGLVVSDTCLIVAPVEELGIESMATNSAKAAFYAPSYARLNVRFAPLERCIEAAIRGRWR